MGVLDPSGPALLKFGSSESTGIIDFFQTLIFGGPAWSQIILFKNSVITTPKGVAPGCEMDIWDGEIRVFFGRFLPMCGKDWLLMC